MNTLRVLLLAGTVLPLAACGADDIASPGGGTIIINPPAPAPTPSPTPTPTPGLVTPAAACPQIADPQGLRDAQTITGPTGTYRVCTLPSRINVSIQLPKIAGLLYQLPGRTDVGTDGGATASAADTNVELRIDPGVIIFAATGQSFLAVNRGNKINAVGTATSPIIFTSRENVLGSTTDQSAGQWGGVILLGRAPVTDCSAPAATPGTVQCERQTEGVSAPAVYGGADPTYNAGKLSYVQIRYSGFVLENNSELQSLTTEGTGTGTTIDHIMSFNSSDDGAEFFGGRVNMKYFVSIGAEDDNLDTDVGVKANFQYVLAIQRTQRGDSIIEADTDNTVDGDIPRQNTKVANATFLYRSTNATDQADLAAILLRGGTDYTLVNTILSAPNYACLRISRAQTASTVANPAIDEAGAPVFRSVVMQCGTKYLAANNVTTDQVAAIFGTGTNNNNDSFTPTLTATFVNGPSETAVAPFNAKTLDPFFDTTTYIGAVKDANDTWYKGWTCNSATADLGNPGNLCTSLPTT